MCGMYFNSEGQFSFRNVLLFWKNEATGNFTLKEYLDRTEYLQCVKNLFFKIFGMFWVMLLVRWGQYDAGKVYL